MPGKVWYYLYVINEFDSDSSVGSTLQVVQIYFDTATYDEIERDVKVIFYLITEAAMYKSLLALNVLKAYPRQKISIPSNLSNI